MKKSSEAFPSAKKIYLGICTGCGEVRHSHQCLDCGMGVEARPFVSEAGAVDDLINLYEAISELFNTLVENGACRPEYAFTMMTLLVGVKKYREELA